MFNRCVRSILFTSCNFLVLCVGSKWRARMSQPSFVLVVGLIMVLSTFGIWSVFSHKVDESLKNMQIIQQGKRQAAYGGKPVVDQFQDNKDWNPYRTYRFPQDGTAGGVYQGRPGGVGSPKPKARSCYLGGDESVRFFPCKAEKLGPRLLPWNTSVIETPVLPSSSRLFPEIGNGHVATVVRSKSVFMNGLYNGANVTSHRARIPSTAAIIVKIASPSKNVTTVFRLDVGRGFPVSPSYNTRTYEIHVTGDVAWMMRQYIQLTNDTGFLTQANGYKALAGIADFWVSRSVYNKTKRLYEIRDVMGPDEYHNRVDNSVYINMIAVQSLRSAQYAAALVGQTPKPEWETVASSMYINLDPKYNYHPEFDNYTRGTVVKQADVVLLRFPFMWSMPKDVFRNDLIYYATVTPGGPAMTWSIFAIGWLRLGEKGKAEEAFHNSTWNIQEPFKVWSENADGSGAYNFHTGMGGYLQSLLYGYLGVSLFDDHIDLDPQLPPSLTAMAARGVDYVGGSLDVEYDAHQMNVTLTQAARVPLCLIFKGKTQKVELKVGSTVTQDRQLAMILPQPHV